MALKHDTVVPVLSQSLGKQSAQEKVTLTLAAEQLLQDQLIKARAKLITLRARIDRLEAELRDEDKREREPQPVWCTQVQAERLKQKRHMEKLNDHLLKLQKKISSDLEVSRRITERCVTQSGSVNRDGGSFFCLLLGQLLSKVKEKLHWSQIEVQAKREQLADVEAQVATKRDLLTRTRHAHGSLQRDNQRLQERRGLLGNKVLLQDFEDTVDTVDHLEEQLQNLKSQEAEVVFSCGKSTKPETTL